MQNNCFVCECFLSFQKNHFDTFMGPPYDETTVFSLTPWYRKIHCLFFGLQMSTPLLEFNRTAPEQLPFPKGKSSLPAMII